jgi:hypothetical protein
MEEAGISAETGKIKENISVRIRQVFDSERYAYSAVLEIRLPSIEIPVT